MAYKTGSKLDTDDLMSIKFLEKATNCQIKDCIMTEDAMYIIVSRNKMGSVIGRNGETIQRLQKELRKKIKVFKFSNNLESFVKNMVPAEIKRIEVKNKNNKKIVELKVEKSKRPLVVGQKGRNIKIIKEFLRRQFDADNVILR